MLGSVKKRGEENISKSEGRNKKGGEPRFLKKIGRGNLPRRTLCKDMAILR